jgi:hypothetical protein
MHHHGDEPGRPQAMDVFCRAELMVVGSRGMGRQSDADVVVVGGSAIIGQDPGRIDDTVPTLAKEG